MTEAVMWKIADLGPLGEEQIDDAEFQGKDLAWSALLQLFEQRREDEGLTLEQLGDRIGRPKSQVHRWLSDSAKMTLRALGLLAEGLDANLVIDVSPRLKARFGNNLAHPSEPVALTWLPDFPTSGSFTSEATVRFVETAIGGSFQVMENAGGN